MNQKGNKIIYFGDGIETLLRIKDYYVFDDNFITKYDNILYDSDGNEYNVLSFHEIEDHVLLYPEIMPYANGWGYKKRSCVKLDREAKIGDMLYIRKRYESK